MTSHIQVFDVPVLVVENFHYHLSEDVLSVYVVDSFEEIESNGQNSLYVLHIEKIVKK